jgi:hypothetical protein
MSNVNLKPVRGGTILQCCHKTKRENVVFRRLHVLAVYHLVYSIQLYIVLYILYIYEYIVTIIKKKSNRPLDYFYWELLRLLGLMQSSWLSFVLFWRMDDSWENTIQVHNRLSCKRPLSRRNGRCILTTGRIARSNVRQDPAVQ